MKKSIYILGVLVLFMTASCGGGKWSCKKRYCNAPTEVLLQSNTVDCVADLDTQTVLPN